MLTLLVACFGQLDVVKEAPILDSVTESTHRSDVERQTQAFLAGVMQSILPVVSVLNLHLVTGLLGLLLDRSDVTAIARARVRRLIQDRSLYLIIPQPGLALLTLFLSRVEVIKQAISSNAEGIEMPTIEDSQQWFVGTPHLYSP